MTIDKRIKRETEPLLIAAQNSTIKENHVKATIDNTQQTSKCKLCDDKYETINKRMQQKSAKISHD